MADESTATVDPKEEETEVQEANAATEAKAAEAEANPVDYEKKFAGTQRQLNRLLKHVGVKTLDEALSTDYSKPPEGGGKSEEAKVEPKAGGGDEPEMPDEDNFRDDYGDLDKAGFRKAMQDYIRQAASHTYQSEQAEALMNAEAEALSGEVAELPGYLLGEEADRDENRDAFKVLVRGMAWHEIGGRPATKAELRASRERLQSLVDGAVTARLAELDKEAETAKGKEPPATKAAPPAKGKKAGAETEPDWGKMTEQERIAWMVDHANPSA